MPSSRELIKEIEGKGWVLVRISKSSHHQFKHPDRPDLITIPHPEKDLKKGLVRKIRKQAGL
jgi:predicted RNA binding protein YcfA (HicA-like mRNA interferase family)